jgi:hypothetical protein
MAFISIPIYEKRWKNDGDAIPIVYTSDHLQYNKTRSRRAAEQNLPVVKLADNLGGQPKVLATSAAVGMRSSSARLSQSPFSQLRPETGTTKVHELTGFCG